MLKHEKYLYLTESWLYSDKDQFDNFVQRVESLISKENSIWAAITRFFAHFGKGDLASISHEDVLKFLLLLTKNNKQATKRNRHSVLSSFYNFSINTALPALTNPCNTAVVKKIFKRPQAIQWQIVDKEAIDEIIFRTTNTRNRLMLELMARGAMRAGEVLKLMPSDIQERTLAIQNPNSGRTEETVYIPRKLLVRLTNFVKTPMESGAMIEFF